MNLLLEKLPVVETFYSIQGEGFHTGEPAFFVRLGGCDVCCTWCDEKSAWNESLYPMIPIEEIAESVSKAKAKSVVVTGGEPFRHNLETLTSFFQSRGIYCLAETSGTGIITGVWNWITLSPKQQQPPLRSAYEKANELKVVVQKEVDLIWAEKNAAAVSTDTLLFLQPEWSRVHEILPTIIRYIKENPQWRLSVQVHKFINIP